jgi:hypothetical protein
VTSFFLGGVKTRGVTAESAYAELRERSALAAGCPARARRIFSVSCRFAGEDREIEVGRPLGRNGDTVTAILDHGRFEPFRVHTDGAGDVAIVDHPVYSVTEFT